MTQSILFLARALDVGGAQRQLVLLARQLHELGHPVSVAVFYPGGELESELTVAGVPVHCLRKRGRWDVWSFALDLLRHVKAVRPAVLHGYLTVPNSLAVLLKPWVPGLKVVFGVRASDIDASRYDWLSRLTLRLEALLARFADLVIVNSQSGHEYHRSAGFPEAKMVVIDNGIDTRRFRPDREAGERIRSAWGIGREERLIGLVGRLDPVKDHGTFLRAAALLARTRPEGRFVCVGTGDSRTLDELRALGEALGLAGRLSWHDARRDMPAVYSAFDLLVSSSRSEGFSNVIAEAMACGVPCVVTNVGDSARIVGATGVVVPPADHQALAAGIEQLLERQRAEGAEPGRRARARVESLFSVAALVRNTLAALEALA